MTSSWELSRNSNTETRDATPGPLRDKEASDRITGSELPIAFDVESTFSFVKGRNSARISARRGTRLFDNLTAYDMSQENLQYGRTNTSLATLRQNSGERKSLQSERSAARYARSFAFHFQGVRCIMRYTQMSEQPRASREKRLEQTMNQITERAAISRHIPFIPKITCHREYEAALFFLNCLSRGEIDLLAKAYRDRILEWEDHDYLFED